MKFLFCMAVIGLMAAFLPNPAKGSENVGLLGQPFVTVPTALAPTLGQAAVWLEPSAIQLGGDWGNYSQETVMNELRNQGFGSGRHKVALVMCGTDQIVTHRALISGTVEVCSDEKSGVLRIPQLGLSLGREKVKVKASLTMVIFSVKTGAVEAMATAIACVDRSAWSDVALVTKYGTVGQNRAAEVCDELMANKAISQAVSQLIGQLPSLTLVLPAQIQAPPATERPRDRSNRNYQDPKAF